MKLYKDVENRKKILLEFIKNNPKTTHREIKKVLHTKVIKVYPEGLEKAFKEAGLTLPRTFKRITKKEKKKIIIEYIRKNPLVGGHVIKKATKINFIPLFKNTMEAFVAAGVKYPRKELKKLRERTADSRKKQLINYLKRHPLESISEIGKKLKIHPYNLFPSSEEMYTQAGFLNFGKYTKRGIKKQNIIIDYIQKNPLATQREINRACKTKMQDLFEKGIFEAYKRAGVNFPFERLKAHGVLIKSIKDDAIRFEEEITKKLSGFGNVIRLVKTRRGTADIILERKNKKVVIEVKNYKIHEISISQVKQLNKYLEDIGTTLGVFVCLKKPKKDSFLIGKNKIVILTNQELSKIAEIVDGSVV